MWGMHTYQSNVWPFSENSAFALFDIICPHKIVLHVKGENSFWKGLRGLGIIPRENVNQLCDRESEKDGLGCRGQVHAKRSGSSDKFKAMWTSKAQGPPLNSQFQDGLPTHQPLECTWGLCTTSDPLPADGMASSGVRPSLSLSLSGTQDLWGNGSNRHFPSC